MSDPQYFRVQNGQTGLVLDLEKPDGERGTRLVLSESRADEGADGQLWALAGDGFLRNKATGLVATVTSGDQATGIPVELWPPGMPQEPDQLWALTSEGRLRSGLVGLLLCADVRPEPGLPVRALAPNAPDGASASQFWHLVRDVPPVEIVTGQAMSLDGAGQGVEIPCPQFGAADLTVEAWVRTTVGGPVCATTGFLDGEGLVLSTEPDGTLTFGLADWNAENRMVVSTGPTQVLDGEWHHVAAVRQGTTGLVYLDGVAVPTDGRVDPAADPVRLTGQGALLLGQAVSPPPVVGEDTRVTTFTLGRYALAGELDEVRVWDRARTPAELAASLHHPVSDVDPNLLGRWSFDGGDAADSSPAGRHGSLRGAPGFVDSEVEFVAAGEPYLVTQATLTQDWITDRDDPTPAREVTGYRVVVTARAADATALPGYLTLSSDEPVTLHLPDGTSRDLRGGGDACTCPTDSRGELAVTIDAKGALTCPALKVRADFMAVDERVVVYPDRHAHAALAGVTGDTLLGRGPDGAPLPSVANGRRTAPVPADTDPRAAAAVAQAVGHVMSTAVTHDVQSDRPLTRSRAVPADLPLPRPYTPRYQDAGLVARGYDEVSDAVATHFLGVDQPVVRVLVAENAPVPHWTYDHGNGSFRPLSNDDAAAALTGLDVTHLDDYTRTFQLDPRVLTGERTIALRSDELVETAERELSARWFGGDFLAEVERAAQVVMTTVETVVTDAVTEAEKVVRTLVVTVVTGIKDAVTGLVQAFDAALQTVEDAVGFVGAMLRKVGAEIDRMVDFLRDLFEWDDILITQQVLEKYLVESRAVVGRLLTGAGKRAVKAVASFRETLDRDLAAWRAGIDPGAARQRSDAARGAPPQNVRSGYLTSMLSHNAGSGPAGGSLEAEFGAIVATLCDDLLAATSKFAEGVPDRLDTSGFADAFSNPDQLLAAGMDLVLQVVGVVADFALDMAEEVLRAIVELLDRLLDALYKIGTTRIDIPVVTPFYEQVVMRGNGSTLTLFGLVALAAALPMTVTYKAITGLDEPVFSKADRDAFLAMDASQYTWIRDPFAAPAPTFAITAGGDVGVEAATTPISDEAVRAIGWAGGFIYAAGATVWGITATGSDLLWCAARATYDSSSVEIGNGGVIQKKFERPLSYLSLGSQTVCLIAALPLATDFASRPDGIAFGLWAAQLVPIVSNLVASVTDKWGSVGDPALTGGYGVICMGLAAWLWYERDHLPDADRGDDAWEGMANVFGNLTWCAQLIKVRTTPVLLGVLLILDLVGYAGLVITTLGRTIADMAASLS